MHPNKHKTFMIKASMIIADLSRPRVNQEENAWNARTSRRTRLMNAN